MKNQLIRARLQNICIALALTFLWMGVVYAQDETRTGDLLFVDVQEVLVGSSAMLDIRRQVNDQITAIRSDAQEEEAALIEEEKQLKAQADSLSEEEIQTGYRQLDERLTTVRAELTQRLQAVQNGAFEAQREVENQLADIFSSMRKERGAVLLINPQGILSADSSYRISPEQDVTSEVVTTLDERLPAVVVMPRIIPPSPDAPNFSGLVAEDVSASDDTAADTDLDTAESAESSDAPASDPSEKVPAAQ